MNHPTENVPSEVSNPIQWDRIAHSQQFKDLVRIKKLFIIPAFIFFFLYYVSLMALVGYAPKLASMRVIGTITVGYLFALSQFAVGWVVAGLYLLASRRFDALAKDILADAGVPREVAKGDRQGDK